MREPNVKFHQLEEYNDGTTILDISHEPSVLCTYKTKRFGYLQVIGYEDRIAELDSEPSLHMLTDRDRKYIERTLRIAWRMVYEAPAMKSRFE